MAQLHIPEVYSKELIDTTAFGLFSLTIIELATPSIRNLSQSIILTMPKHQITIDWQFDATEEDVNLLKHHNIAEKPTVDASGESTSEDLVRGIHRISKHHLSECLQKNGPVNIEIIEAYLDILCDYHSSNHRTLKENLPKYINLNHTFFDKLSQRPSSENPNQGLK